MMQRLTKRTPFGIVGNNDKVLNYPLYKVANSDPLDQNIIGQCFNKLAEYEDLEEQGLLMRKPCKVGDIVYSITNDGKIYPVKATREVRIVNGVLHILCESCKYVDLVSYDDIGKTVFLTKKEAEQKLKEMESD